MVEHIVQQIVMDHKRIMNTTHKDVNELYNDTNTCKVVKTGIWKDVRYWITTIGMHPCAYVECDEEFLDEHQDEYDLIEGIHVHGGVTFGGRLDLLRAFQSENIKDVIAFGWDYGHCDDWTSYFTCTENLKYNHHMWTVEEIEDACKRAVDQYLTMVEGDKVTRNNLEKTEEKLKLNPVWENEAIREHLMWLKENDFERYTNLIEKIVK